MVNPSGSESSPISGNMEAQIALNAFSRGNLDARVVRTVADGYLKGALKIGQIERAVQKEGNLFLWAQLLSQILQSNEPSTQSITSLLAILADTDPGRCVSLLFDQAIREKPESLARVCGIICKKKLFDSLFEQMHAKKGNGEDLSPVFRDMWELGIYRRDICQYPLKLCRRAMENGFPALEGGTQRAKEQFLDTCRTIARREHVSGLAWETANQFADLVVQYFPELVPVKDLADWFTVISRERLYDDFIYLLGRISQGYNPFQESDWVLGQPVERILSVLPSIKEEDVLLSFESWQQIKHSLLMDCFKELFRKVKEELSPEEKVRKQQYFRVFFKYFVQEPVESWEEEQWHVFATSIRGEEPLFFQTLMDRIQDWQQRGLFTSLPPSIKKLAGFLIEALLDDNLFVRTLFVNSQEDASDLPLFFCEELYFLVIDHLEQVAQGDSSRKEPAKEMLAQALYHFLEVHSQDPNKVSEKGLLSLYERPFLREVFSSAEFKTIALEEIKKLYSSDVDFAFERLMNSQLAKFLVNRPEQAKGRFLASDLLYDFPANRTQGLISSWEDQLELFAEAERNPQKREEVKSILERVPAERRIPFFLLAATFPFAFAFPFSRELYGEEVFDAINKGMNLVEEAQEEVGNYCKSLIEQEEIRSAVQLYAHAADETTDLENRLFALIKGRGIWEQLFVTQIPKTMAQKVINHFLVTDIPEEQREAASYLVFLLISQVSSGELVELVGRKFPERLDQLLTVWEQIPTKTEFRNGVKLLYQYPEHLKSFFSKLKRRYRNMLDGQLGDSSAAFDYDKMAKRLSLINHTAEALFEREAAQGKFPLLYKLVAETSLVNLSRAWITFPDLDAQTFLFSAFQEGLGKKNNTFLKQCNRLSNLLKSWETSDDIDVQTMVKVHRKAVEVVSRSRSYLGMVEFPGFKEILDQIHNLSSQLLQSEIFICERQLAQHHEKMARENYRIISSEEFPYRDRDGQEKLGHLEVFLNHDYEEAMGWINTHPDTTVEGEYSLSRFRILQDVYAMTHHYALPEESVSTERWNEIVEALLQASLSSEDRENLREVLDPLHAGTGQRIDVQKRKIEMIFEEAKKEGVVDELALRLSDAVGRCGDGLDQALEHLIVRFVTKVPDSLGGKISKLITRYKQQFIEDHGDKRAFLPGEFYSKRYGEPNTQIPRILKERLRITFVLPGEFTDVLFPNYNAYRFAHEGYGHYPEDFEISSVIQRFFEGGILSLEDRHASHSQRFSAFTKEFLINMIKEDLNKSPGDPSKELNREDFQSFLKLYYDAPFMEEWNALMEAGESEGALLDPLFGPTEKGIERILYLLGYLNLVEEESKESA